jgi:outer membrane lipopolysaccharide assembly protein LptE/RlpB
MPAVAAVAAAQSGILQQLPEQQQVVQSRQTLTAELISLATGEDNLGSLEEIEIIFNTVHELGGLGRCNSLRSFSLIDSNLQRISHLAPVARTLVRLCLCDNAIKKIENLQLPVLRELFLHHNRISKISGLEGCPQLQRLWLFSNRIGALENLQHCPGLRELWIQDNCIERIEGLSSLQHLQSLSLAGNPITDLRSVQSLAALPLLADLCFDDIHFGTCPVAQQTSYREFTLCCVKRLRRLDGTEVVGNEREVAQGNYLRQVLDFNDKLDALQKEQEREVAAIEARRRSSASITAQLKADIASSLLQVERIVAAGRTAIAQEHARKQAVYDRKAAELQATLSALQAAYCSDVDAQIAHEQRCAAEEDSLYRVLESRAEAEQVYTAAITLLESSTSSSSDVSCVCADVAESSPEFQQLARQLRKAQHRSIQQQQYSSSDSGTAATAGAVVLLRATRLLNARLTASYSMCDASSSGSSSISSKYLALYLCVSVQTAKSVCEAGLQGICTVLYSDPATAVKAAERGCWNCYSAGTLEQPRSDNSTTASTSAAGVADVSHEGYAGILLVFKLAAVAVGSKQQGLCIDSYQQAVAAAQQATAHAVQVTVAESSSSSSSDEHYCIVPRTVYSAVLPEALLLCGCGALTQDTAAVQRQLEELSAHTLQPQQPAQHSSRRNSYSSSSNITNSISRGALLAQLEQRMSEAVAQHHARMLRDDAAAAGDVRSSSMSDISSSTSDFTGVRDGPQRVARLASDISEAVRAGTTSSSSTASTTGRRPQGRNSRS